ncbi:site-specific tyrosine recombinase/integron integrase [Paenibacillus sp.]|uniref:site-specific tyrosine recombinase/integron integrase n=1 Tax=Paenibacillus sp. TaxID=58172 RepID=UPI002D2452DE|nr:site-specific tyrosine recombinase/integron integrase [Paenibacillus sp.]HZG84358.1 site-specific tyrosine recombinase/integron integrase [Paenibacillus sp.]
MKVTFTAIDERRLGIAWRPWDEEVLSHIRTIPFREYDPDRRMWLVPRTRTNAVALLELFRGAEMANAWVLYAELPSSSRIEAERGVDTSAASATVEADRDLDVLLQELRLRGYSAKTIRAYAGHVRRFLAAAEGTPTEWDANVVTQYSERLLQTGHSHSYVNQAISAVSFYMRHVCKQAPATVRYVRPKREKKLPNVLSGAEVLRLLQAVTFLKHRAILSLTYSAGLRVGEVVRLRVQDLDLARNTVFLRQSKGRKDRYSMLSAAALSLVQQYLAEARPETWLFPGQDPRRHLSERSVQKVFEQAKTKARIQKDVTVHSLRHSFATHLLEAGVDLRHIQELLGHKNVKTTELYTHVSTREIRRIQSPLDRLMAGQDALREGDLP